MLLYVGRNPVAERKILPESDTLVIHVVLQFFGKKTPDVFPDFLAVVGHAFLLS